MENENLLAVGLDVGTGGVRALAMDLNGRVAAVGRAAFLPESKHCDGVLIEQDPHAWTTAAQAALQEMTVALPAGRTIVGIAVDATSGTFLLADARNRPLARAIIYDDLRATAEAPRAANCLRGTLKPFGIEISAAFALPKILHLAATHPTLFRDCRRVIHQTDWVVGMLCGRYDVTDISTALKSGADPGTLTWPAAIERDLGLPRDWFPDIVLPGTPIGEVTPAAAAATGLPAGTVVVAGCTDGTAGFLASGATAPGDLNVTLGTTLVWKAIAARPLVDPTGVVYNHRHPAGGFLPGAASSTGGGWTNEHFGNADLDRLGSEAAALLPTGRLVYPLLRTGERFPFAAPTARGFGLDETLPPAERFAAGMEGTAMVERLGIERFESLGLNVGPTVYATGGAVSSETWLRIRASVMRRTYAIPQQPECAVGAAVLAAAAYLGDFTRAVQGLVRIGRRVEQEPQLAVAYDEQFLRFKTELQRRGYL
jgi:sugar (pentulose or hexulose) kinase